MPSNTLCEILQELSKYVLACITLLKSMLKHVNKNCDSVITL